MGWFRRRRKRKAELESLPEPTAQMCDRLVGEIDRIAQDHGWIVRAVKAPLILPGQDPKLVEEEERKYILKYYTPNGGARIELTPHLPYLHIFFKGRMGRYQDEVHVSKYVSDNGNGAVQTIQNREELETLLDEYIQPYLRSRSTEN